MSQLNVSLFSKVYNSIWCLFRKCVGQVDPLVLEGFSFDNHHFFQQTLGCDRILPIHPQTYKHQGKPPIHAPSHATFLPQQRQLQLAHSVTWQLTNLHSDHLLHALLPLWWWLHRSLIGSSIYLPLSKTDSLIFSNHIVSIEKIITSNYSTWLLNWVMVKRVGLQIPSHYHNWIFSYIK